jgi:hypothetical protein
VTTGPNNKRLHYRLAALANFLESENCEKAAVIVALVAAFLILLHSWASPSAPASNSWFMELIPGTECQDVTKFLAPASEIELARGMGSVQINDHGGNEVTIVEERSDRIVNVHYFRTMEACRSAANLDKYR